MIRLLVVIRDFYIERISFLPDEADSPLTVDPNTVLSFSISVEFFQMIAFVDGEHSEIASSMEHL